ASGAAAAIARTVARSVRGLNRIIDAPQRRRIASASRTPPNSTPTSMSAITTVGRYRYATSSASLADVMEDTLRPRLTRALAVSAASCPSSSTISTRSPGSVGPRKVTTRSVESVIFRPWMRRQRDVECRPCALLAVDVNTTTGLSDDAGHCRQAETTVAVLGLGAEERIEDPRLHLRRHAGSRIGDA